MLDINNIRSQYPILSREVNGKPLIYLDSAATSQTPQCVVDKITEMYTQHKANVHRGVHRLSQEATDCVEHTRARVCQYLNAQSIEEIVFTRGTTEAINLVASSFGESLCNGDEIILTVMEHHSNIVPWQLLGKRKRIRLRVVPIAADGTLRRDIYSDMFSENTRLVALCHVSNVLGTVNPIKELIAEAHSHGVPVLVDGAQAAPHLRVDVRDLDADFYALSAHKMYGPTGVGVLYGKRRLLEQMNPYQGGGEMIGHVAWDKTTFADLPFKFEAGTPDFVGISAFAEALDYIDSIGIDNISDWEHCLLKRATEGLMKIPGMRIFGTQPEKSGVISFLVDNIHHYDMGMLLDQLGIAVRTGHHCAQPLMTALGIEGTVRASFAVYNTFDEVDAFVAAVKRVADMLRLG
ncbi:MAG: cysteine desulfurase [bacterium]|nr:cysteine desulfurase [bacterium]